MFKIVSEAIQRHYETRPVKIIYKRLGCLKEHMKHTRNIYVRVRIGGQIVRRLGSGIVWRKKDAHERQR
jgi:hypothetical protein